MKNHKEFSLILITTFIILFSDISETFADTFIKVPALKYSTKAVSSLDLDVLIKDENITNKSIQASVTKQITKTSRKFALRQKKSEVLDKVIKVSCNEKIHNDQNTSYYGCVEDNKRASAKNLTECSLPKDKDKYSQIQYMCSKGKRALDVYRITNVCGGTIPTDTIITRETKKEKPNWDLKGEGAKIKIKRGSADINALPGVYFLTPIENIKNFKSKSFSELIFTSQQHPALKKSKIITYNLSISGHVGLLEQQSLGKRIRKVADSYCNGGALQMAKAFSGSIAKDLKWALSDRKIEYKYSWQAIDLRTSSLDYFNESIEDANKVNFSVVNLSNGEIIKSNIKISNITPFIFNYTYFKDNYLKGIFEDFILEEFERFKKNDFFKLSESTDKIKSGDTLVFKPQTNVKLTINVEKRGFKSLYEEIIINPFTSDVKIILVPSKENLFPENERSRVVIN